METLIGMRGRWTVVFAALLAMFVLFLPEQTEAASVQASVQKLEREAKQLDQKIRSTALVKPYDLFNQTKKSYSNAQKEVSKLKDGPTKRQYVQRLNAAYATIQKAAYYITAIESGEKLTGLKSRMDRALSAGDVDYVYEEYSSFDQQLRKTSALIQKVSYPSVRNKMIETFQRPAEATKQRAFYPINIMHAFDRIIEAYANDDIEEVERLLALCDAWLVQVKDAKMKEELALYLEEFKAPMIIDVE